MITDRTQNDVALAETLRLKIQSGATLTTVEANQFERGSCTNTMLNRIESAKNTLKTTMNANGYYFPMTYKQWSVTDLFDFNAYTAFMKDIKTLRSQFYMPNTPNAPDYLYGFREANAAEQIFVDVENYLSDMISNYRECGTFQCGEE